jgi:hypothetical protein
MLLSRDSFPDEVEWRCSCDPWSGYLAQRVEVKIVYDDIADAYDDLYQVMLLANPRLLIRLNLHIHLRDKTVAQRLWQASGPSHLRYDR